MKRSAEAYVCALYGKMKLQSVNEARSAIFWEKYNKNKTVIELSLLPPCQANLVFHLQRANPLLRHPFPLLALCLQMVVALLQWQPLLVALSEVQDGHLCLLLLLLLARLLLRLCTLCHFPTRVFPSLRRRLDLPSPEN